jgi:hypothetical protein
MHLGFWSAIAIGTIATAGVVVLVSGAFAIACWLLCLWQQKSLIRPVQSDYPQLWMELRAALPRISSMGMVPRKSSGGSALL